MILPKYIKLEKYEISKATQLKSTSFSEAFDLQEIERFELDNCILGTITHSFENTTLPIELDTMFIDKDIEKHYPVNATILGCSNNRKRIHKELWKGYNHLAFIHFNKGIPKALELIRSSETNLIICNSIDLAKCLELHQQYGH